MSVRALHNFFALLAIVALSGVVVLVIARLVPSAAARTLLAQVHSVRLWLAGLVATTAMLGSLYFSEYGNRWEPCRFCWFQRICMYSLALILVIAAVRRDDGIKFYAAPLAGVGLALSTWHILLEQGVVEESKACTVTCAVPYLTSFGEITLAVMAFSAFAAILALLLIPHPLEEEDHGQSSAS